MNKYKIIGITGLKYNGKDTIANYLSTKYKYTHIAFADSLKNACSVLFGFNYEQLHGYLKETPDPYWFGLTPRQILQFVGTELFRNNMHKLNENFHDNFWLLCTEKKIQGLLQNDKDICIVISDVRFPNECNMIKKMNGIIIRVDRSNVNNTIDLHPSETLIQTLHADFEIKNNGSIDDLYKIIDNIIN